MSKKVKSIDKQVYFERRWTRGQLVSQSGTVVEVRLPDGTEIDVPFHHVRDIRPSCKDCGRNIWSSSYQAHSGDSYCVQCYDQMDVTNIDLLFSGYQWWSWDGQMAIRDMDDEHLINSLGRLKRNAVEAAELSGGSPEEHLSVRFHHLVTELRRRRPEDIGSIKMNSMLLYIWTVIMMVLTRSGAVAEEKEKASKQKKKKQKRPGKQRVPSLIDQEIPW